MNNKTKYLELYFSDNKPAFRGIRKNNLRIGYAEFHSSKHTTYYIK